MSFGQTKLNGGDLSAGSHGEQWTLGFLENLRLKSRCFHLWLPKEAVALVFESKMVQTPNLLLLPTRDGRSCGQSIPCEQGREEGSMRSLVASPVSRSAMTYRSAGTIIFHV